MWKRILAFLFVASVADAQNYTITTVAGGGPVIAGQSATSYALNQPSAVAVDAAGNRYIALSNWCQVWVVNPSGTLTQVIGNGTCGFSGDNGPAVSAHLDAPGGVAVDSSGNLYIADSNNNVIRKVSGGIITTVVGNGTQGYSGDGGSATSAELYGPEGVAVDNSGNLYIADTINSRIRKVSAGIITTVAGNGTQGYSGDGGSATSAELGYPQGVAVDSPGNLYIADPSNSVVRKVSGGIITTVVGNGSYGYSGDGGSATSAGLSPGGIAVDSSGNLYIADGSNARIRKVSGGIITTVVGNGTEGYNGDNISATSAQLNFPTGVAVDSSGNLYIADGSNDRIRKVSGGIITTVVGSGAADGGDGAAGTSAQLDEPTGSAVDSSGNLFITDWGACVVRKVAAGTGIISTVAGTSGFCGYNGDNISAASAQLNLPYGVAVDSSGNLYIADYLNNRIRKVSGGIITTVAGTGNWGYNGDNISATSAELNSPFGVAVDNSGNLFIADYDNSRIRKVSGGIITTVAGNGSYGYSGDDGSAASAELNYPSGVAVDSSGDLYIADTSNQRVRKVSGGTITTMAGNGSYGYSGDGGSANSAELANPQGVAVDSSGSLYIADYGNNRVRKVSGGIITTVAGNGFQGYNGDNFTAASAELAYPNGVATDSSGNVYVSDTGNNRIRRLTPTGPVSVNVTSNPSGLTLIVDLAPITTPQLFAWATGSCHTISASTQPGGTGIQYDPIGTFPDNPCFSSTASYNVNFTTQYYLTTSAGTGGAISPPSGWYNAGTGLSVSATPGTGYSFAGFSGALTGTANPQSIAMNAPASVTANFTLMQTFAVSGQVTVSGVGLSGVAIDVTGSATASATTNAPGNYSFALAAGGTYTLSASLAGYNFSAPITFSNLGANQTATFTGIAGLDFYTVNPCRIADTRGYLPQFTGAFGPPSMTAGQMRQFPIPSSSLCVTPATAAAYSLNFTAVPPTSGPWQAGSLTAWPTSQPTPNVSTLNYTSGIVANAAIVPAGTGAIDVWVTEPADVLIDINGYFAPPLSSGLEFYPVNPCRIADTRGYLPQFTGAFGPPSMTAGQMRQFPIPSSPLCVIPATAAAYSLNFTVVPPAVGPWPQGSLTAWPTSQPTPNVSTLNYTSGIVANAAIVPAGTGAIDVWVTEPADVLIDINGYFAPPLSSGMHFYPVTTCRIADTRGYLPQFTGAFGPPSMTAGQMRQFPIPSSPLCVIPATAAAYSLNFTVVPPAVGPWPQGSLTTWPVSGATPNVSTLNYTSGIVANAAIVPAGTTGAIYVWMTEPADVLIDINGYFAP